MSHLRQSVRMRGNNAVVHTSRRKSERDAKEYDKVWLYVPFFFLKIEEVVKYDCLYFTKA